MRRREAARKKELLKEEERCHTWSADGHKTFFENDLQFFEKFELRNFPFDVQFCSVPINVGSRKGAFCIPVPGAINQSMQLSEWEVLAPSFACYPSKFGPATMGVFRFTLQRKYKWFVVNHLLLIGLLTTLVFYVFVIPPDEVADRASVVHAAAHGDGRQAHGGCRSCPT